MKIGLVLGGGGARGLAHIGVIKVLQSAGIPIDVITGTSMGALIGGVYAQQGSAENLEKQVIEFIMGPKFKELGVDNFRQKEQLDPDDILSQLTRRVKRRLVINLAANRLALLKMERLQVAVTELLENRDIERCKIPFACVAADLNSGHEIEFREGNIREAVAASSAIPGYIPPVSMNSKQLIDGSIVNNFPVQLAKDLGANLIILVNVSLQFEENIKVENVIDLVMRAGQITNRRLNELLQEKADIVISPKIGSIHWSEFKRVKEVISRGEEAAQEELTSILSVLRKRRNPFRKILRSVKSIND